MPAKKPTPNRKVTKGRSNLKASKKLSWKKLLPLVLLVAVVGGFFVWRSFAATKPGRYQYSVHSCKPADRSLSPQDRECHNYSAEAVTYRMYRVVLKADPSTAAYRQWTQQMAGGDESLEGRLSPEALARRVHGLPSAKTGNGIMRNRALVNNIYLNVFGNTRDKAGINYWANQMNTKKWSVPKLLHEFVNSKAIVDKYFAEFTQAMTSNKVPRITVVAVARQKQEARTAEGKRINAVTKKTVDAMKEKSKDNNARKVAAGKIAEKPGSQISQGDLNVIKHNNIEVIKARLEGFGGEDYKGLIERNYGKVKALYDASERVTSYSPDITNYGVTTEHKIANNYKTDLHNNYANAKWLLGEATKAYNTAKKKYDAHQAYLRAKRDCEARGGTYSNGCQMPQRGAGCPSMDYVKVNGTCKRVFVKPSGYGKCSAGYRIVGMQMQYQGYKDDVYGCTQGTGNPAVGMTKLPCPAGYHHVDLGSGRNVWSSCSMNGM